MDDSGCPAIQRPLQPPAALLALDNPGHHLRLHDQINLILTTAVASTAFSIQCCHRNMRLF